MEEGNNNIIYFAEANFRNEHKRFGIKRNDRTKHMYVIGKTGMGKSTMLENMAVQDIQNGEGVAFIDPHGGTADLLLDYVPEERIKDVIYFNPSDTEFPVSFNIMEDVGVDKRHLVANGLMSSFKKIWPDVWSERMQYILNNIIMALLEYPGSTLLGINRMLSDKDYRKQVVDNTTDPAIKAFWNEEFAKYSEKFMVEAGAAIQNKIGQLASNPLIRNILGQSKSSFDIRDIMDGKKILIMNLSKGKIGEQNSALLGTMLITKIYLGAMSRAGASMSEMGALPEFFFFVDEFQSFASDSFADILSEARKYKLSLTIAHQYIEQMEENVRAAVFGNVGTMVSFRVGAFDADILEKEFTPEFLAADLVNLGFAKIYLRLMIDGVGSRPFSASTLPPIGLPEQSFKAQIIEASRQSYALPRAEVEEKIKEWHNPVNMLGSRASLDATRPSESAKPKLFEAVCAACGKKTFVPFEPDGKRPTYCKTHRDSSPPPKRADGGSARYSAGGLRKNQDAISLSNLKEKVDPRENSKESSNLKELRSLLQETLDEKKESNPPAGGGGGAKNHTLRPGDKVQFK